MGLDIYVGTLERYYCGDWQTVVQQTIPGARVIRPGYTPPKPKVARKAVKTWNRAMGKALGVTPLRKEAPSLPYFTDKPNWDGYGALLLCAACDDQGVEPSDHEGDGTGEGWLRSPLFERYGKDDVETRYPQLLLGVEMWLPMPPTVFRAKDPLGKARVFGSGEALLAELKTLNARRWRLGADETGASRAEAEEDGVSLDGTARFGWSMMHRLAAAAVVHRLPLILDY